MYLGENYVLKTIPLDYGVSDKDRTITLNDAIELSSIAWLNDRIDYIIRESKSKKPIDLRISSEGGDVYGMFGIIDVMRNAPCKINTIGLGSVMSAASIILASGTGYRAISKNTIVMIHQISSWIAGNSTDITVEAVHVKELQDIMYTTLESVSNKPKTFWEKNAKSNLYLPAKMCLEYKLVDKII